MNADFSELRLEKDNTMVNLIGNVSFKHGDLSLRSQRAVWYRTAGQVVFIDSVRIEDSTQTLSADRVTYYRNSRNAVADGSVVLFSKKELTQIKGEHGEYDRVKKYVRFTGSTSLTLKPDKGDSTITVTADSMEYYPDEKKGIAKGKVHITKADMTSTCDQATWMNQEDKIILNGNPESVKQNDRLVGEEMEIFIQNEKIKRIEVEGNAKASHIEVIDSLNQTKRESFLGAKKMIFFLQDEKVNQVTASGNATSIYYPKSSKESAKNLGTEKNEASGDTIDLFLLDDRISQVLIKGGAMGNYVFPKEKTKDSSTAVDTIRYSADHIDYQIKKNLITLQGQSNLKYGQVSLSAGQIIYQTEDEIMAAERMKIQEGEEEKWEGSPVLKEGKEEIKGERMSYDLRSKRGKVKSGITGIQEGTYKGELLRKITDKVLLADKGTYTTCDKPEPHFHFYARRMKIISKDKVIAEPVVLYIADLPVAAIPYYIFPIKPGRHSGLLTFDLGNLEAGQRFIRNLGYYWAISDYWDLKTAVDYYEGSGWLVKSQARYAKRYMLNGNIAGSYNRQSSWNLASFTKMKHDRWDLTFNHQHIISPTLSLAASGTFLSDKNYWRDMNLDPQERRNRSLYSQANFSKSWGTSSATLALDHRWNLDTDERTLNIPVVRFSRSSLPLFPPKESKSGSIGKEKGGIGSFNPMDRKWYNSIYYSFSTSFLNYQYSRKMDGYFDRKKFTASDNSFSFSAPQKLLGWLVLNPGFHYQETWYYIFKTNLSDSSKIPGNSSARRGTYSASVSANTALYGTLNPKLGKLIGIRHVMTPGMSFSWQPAFNRKNEYLSFTGAGGSGSKSKSMSFGLNNLVQIKTKSNDSGKEAEKKFDLFNLNFSSGYSFLAKSHKLSNLSSTLRSDVIKNVDFSFSMTHDFYDKTGDLNALSPRWIYFSFDTRISFRGSWEESPMEASQKLEESGSEGETEELSAGENEKPKGKLSQFWSLNITHRYSKNRGGYKTHWVSTSLSLPLTHGWLMNYLNRYDFSENKITEQTFEFYRDMHCWEGRFTWIATGYRKGYYFRINIKALPAVKLEKSRGGLREIFF